MSPSFAQESFGGERRRAIESAYRLAHVTDKAVSEIVPLYETSQVNPLSRADSRRHRILE
jgi:hypothetical protein